MPLLLAGRNPLDLYSRSISWLREGIKRFGQVVVSTVSAVPRWPVSQKLTFPLPLVTVWFLKDHTARGLRTSMYDIVAISRVMFPYISHPTVRCAHLRRWSTGIICIPLRFGDSLPPYRLLLLPEYSVQREHYEHFEEKTTRPVCRHMPSVELCNSATWYNQAGNPVTSVYFCQPSYTIIVNPFME